MTMGVLNPCWAQKSNPLQKLVYFGLARVKCYISEQASWPTLGVAVKHIPRKERSDWLYLLNCLLASSRC